jgi:hypothetical protein
LKSAVGAILVFQEEADIVLPHCKFISWSWVTLHTMNCTEGMPGDTAELMVERSYVVPDYAIIHENN